MCLVLIPEDIRATARIGESRNCSALEAQGNRLTIANRDKEIQGLLAKINQPLKALTQPTQRRSRDQVSTQEFLANYEPTTQVIR